MNPNSVGSMINKKQEGKIKREEKRTEENLFIL